MGKGTHCTHRGTEKTENVCIPEVGPHAGLMQSTHCTHRGTEKTEKVCIPEVGPHGLWTHISPPLREMTILS